MKYISATRLRIRSMIYIVPFIWLVYLTARQLKRSRGFIGGRLHIDSKKAFWTITGWKSKEEMLSYRNSGAHKRAMPKLLKWCDEASVVNWEQEEIELPDLKDAYRRMKSEGRLSKVNYPSRAQLENHIEELKLSDKFDRIIFPLQKSGL